MGHVLGPSTVVPPDILEGLDEPHPHLTSALFVQTCILAYINFEAYFREVKISTNPNVGQCDCAYKEEN